MRDSRHNAPIPPLPRSQRIVRSRTTIWRGNARYRPQLASRAAERKTDGMAATCRGRQQGRRPRAKRVTAPLWAGNGVAAERVRAQQCSALTAVVFEMLHISNSMPSPVASLHLGVGARSRGHQSYSLILNVNCSKD